MSLFNIYREYLVIILISLILGIVRWSVMDYNFPLFAKPKIIFEEFILYQDFKEIVDNNSYPIIDARDFSSYDEGYIGNAYNIDIDLLYELDEEVFSNINNIINNHGYSDNQFNILEDRVIDTHNDNQTIIVYCWNPTCDRAEDLISMLIDTSDYFGKFGKYFTKTDFSIYKGGWDEWDSIQKK
tara:strand:- start:172 stop:723 length:552 start_codon:yes stop_codon:yes gene_type:complete